MMCSYLAADFRPRTTFDGDATVSSLFFGSCSFIIILLYLHSIKSLSRLCAVIWASLARLAKTAAIIIYYSTRFTNDYGRSDGGRHVRYKSLYTRLQEMCLTHSFCIYLTTHLNNLAFNATPARVRSSGHLRHRYAPKPFLPSYPYSCHA